MIPKGPALANNPFCKSFHYDNQSLQMCRRFHPYDASTSTSKPNTSTAAKFLFDIMKKMGFGLKWRKWIESCFRPTSISVLINGSQKKEFNLQKGVRQGDLLSPYLFIIASEGLNILSKILVKDDIIRGVEIGDNKIVISHIQFAKDTIFFGDWNKRNIRNIHKTLICFQKLSGLRINFKKTYLYGVGVSKFTTENMAARLGCNTVWDNIIKLGVDMFDAGINIEDQFVRIIGDGHDIQFWDDLWVGNNLLKSLFPQLHRLDSNSSCSVRERVTFANGVWSFNWAWKRMLTGRLLGEQDQLSAIIAGSADIGSGHSR
ncbi:uncharacterized protein [Rutidosis leptorrhynchoides]|uniref:uncharacterized protein n=1 Tax=Rutidosis leptorrhynchoides TaxID=125765 RepID=UPI003A998F9A